MPFKDAFEFLDTYRDKRTQALNNEVAMSWSTADVETFAELLKKFEREDEVLAWKNEYDNSGEVTKLQALGTKIAFLCSATRDIRMQFAAGEDDRARCALDFDRFAYMRLGFNRKKMDVLNKALKSKEG